ncbi:hypothetical protein PF66_02692 [Pseudomonas asplenii]|uniref:Uncharacterized protein n=1 Tax=Pseudomonas asplenii TaxID=53407 RepID=A0A0M9GGI1_9PSED|nr:hypothetical protein [Pseudomonas fuscovaginae]KPA90631.1 hypothetical protein PF66_02692 [Pseudomonas fuscovaginae]
MGKSTQLRLIGGKEPRQFMWEAVRDNRNGFTANAIARISGQTEGSVKTYIRALNKAALIELVDGEGEFGDHRWRLVRDEGAEHPRVNVAGKRTNHGAGLENLWRTLRIMGGEMTAAQAAEMASVGEVKVAQAYALNYFWSLARAGYLIKSDTEGQGPATFRLKPEFSSGPRHPIIQRTTSMQVFDPNLNRVTFSSVEAGGVSGESSPSNDMQEQNARLKKLLAEFLAKGLNGPDPELLQRAELELA